MTTTTSPSHAALADVARDPGPWTQVYLDVSVDTADPPQVIEQRITGVSDQLARAGAPEADIAAVAAALEADAPAPSPLCHFVIVGRGEVVIDEWIPGLAVAPEIVAYGPVPDVSPLLVSQPADFAVAVVETERDGGEIRLLRVGATAVEAEETVQGRTDTLHAVTTGGWRQDLLQSHARETWRRTQAELAAAVDDLVRREQPRLVVVAGEIRARQLLADELSAASRDLLSILPLDTRADGSDHDALDRHVAAEVDRILAADKDDVLDRIAIHEGRGDTSVASGVGEVVRALAAAQADIVVLDPDRLRDRTVLALDDAPWIASSEEETLGAGVLAVVPAQVGMVRAAVLGDTRVLFTDSRSVPDGTDAVTLPGEAPAAALLRWPLGPEVPAT